jgi:hypothetical protein
VSTDIHGPYLELELAPGQWQQVVDLYWMQDYAAFALMAGVHSEGLGIPTLFEPRGEPAKMSVAFELHANVDCHTASWLTPEELGAVLDAYPPDEGPAFQLRLAVRVMDAAVEEATAMRAWAHARWQRLGLKSPEPPIGPPSARLAFCFDN